MALITHSPVSFTGTSASASASDLLRSSSSGIPLRAVRFSTRKRGDFGVVAKIKKAKKQGYSWSDNPDPNVPGGVLSRLSPFKPLKEKPKPVTLNFEKPLVDLEKKIIDVKETKQNNRLESEARRLYKLLPISPNYCIRSSSLSKGGFRFLTSAASNRGMEGVAKISQTQSLPGIYKWSDNRKVTCFYYSKHSHNQSRQRKSNQIDDKSRKPEKKARKGEQHLWKKRDSARSGEKALSLVRIVSELPNEKEAVYGALDKWTAWEIEFPLIAVAKALRILKKHNQWLRLIQVAKWMLSKGQGTTMGTYDTLLLAFDMDNRVDEAASLWNMLLHTHTRSISKQLFSRMISLYDHHDMPDKIIEIFGDMEELGVRPDEDTVRRVSRAFKKLGQEDERKLVLKRYMCRWKYAHFNGERVRVPRNIPD